MRIWPGVPYPLGATWDGEGVNFAVFSTAATKVELCLFDAEGLESHRIPLTERTNRVWHCYLPDVRPGQLYGFRVHGPHAPGQGQRFNANKLLLDPYAKAIAGDVRWDDAVFGYRIGDPAADLSFDQRDSAEFMPKCVVIDTAFTWGDDRPPRTPWTRTVIYECHVRGMTMRHPDVPTALRGTYGGLASDAVLDHLLELGVTAVELLPVHHSVSERRLRELGLGNYWGYNTIGFFAPDPRYSRGCHGEQVLEFKTMVKALHRVGLEVILDVVYNHTAEGNELGPTLCFKGLDNESYYALSPHGRRYYQDFTGCGNSMNVRHPRTLQLMLDSLRYWVTEMHVDGFRFDLATTLGRNPIEFDTMARFFATVQQDPVLSQVKLIAEPWDVGPGGYRLGGFPPGWAEWNGRYRDTVRRYWRGDRGMVADLASRLSGSSDIFQGSDRGPHASINFVTCHDGFTLRDLVSFEQKHNEANGEENRDGADDNHSRNWGVEGLTDSPAICRVRERMIKNLLATLAFSQGVPMLSHGDELGRTQHGNNNGYCHDSPLTWLDWTDDPTARSIHEFTRKIFRIRSENPVFRRRSFFVGAGDAADGKDVSWLHPEGREMTSEDWTDPHNRVIGMMVDGTASDDVDERGRPNLGHTLLLLQNASNRARTFELVAFRRPGYWRELVNTASPGQRVPKGRHIHLAPHSLVLLSYEEP